jgi:hypothetical protein
MSLSSFPRAEHIALLRTKMEERLRDRGLPLELAERGLDQLKCRYRFGLRRRAPDEKPPPSHPESSKDPANDPVNDWVELPIHFQIAERLEEGRGDAEFDRVLEGFLFRYFPELPGSHDGG